MPLFRMIGKGARELHQRGIWHLNVAEADHPKVIWLRVRRNHAPGPLFRAIHRADSAFLEDHGGVLRTAADQPVWPPVYPPALAAIWQSPYSISTCLLLFCYGWE